MVKEALTFKGNSILSGPTSVTDAEAELLSSESARNLLGLSMGDSGDTGERLIAISSSSPSSTYILPELNHNSEELRKRLEREDVADVVRKI